MFLAIVPEIIYTLGLMPGTRVGISGLVHVYALICCIVCLLCIFSFDSTRALRACLMVKHITCPIASCGRFLFPLLLHINAYENRVINEVMSHVSLRRTPLIGMTCIIHSPSILSFCFWERRVPRLTRSSSCRRAW